MDRQIPSPGALLGSFLSSFSRTRRLEDRIRKFCFDAISATDPEELDRIMEHLKTALHDHTSRTRRMVFEGPIQPERRKLSSVLTCRLRSSLQPEEPARTTPEKSGS